jgi:hypothetical protein
MAGTTKRTLCGNCGTDLARAIDSDVWVTVIDWRRDVLCPRCQGNYEWRAADWHVLMTHDGRLLGYVRRGALQPGSAVIVHTPSGGNVAAEVLSHHTDSAGEWNGITRVRATADAPGFRKAGQIWDTGTITLEPIPS